MAIMAVPDRSNQKLTRKEHIVPRLLLTNFGDPAGVLWVYSKNQPARRSTAENECVEKDFYEYELNGRKTNNKYEDWLARIETDASAVLRRLVNHQQLTDREVAIWAIFVAALFVRTRKVRMQISENMVREFKKKTEDPAFIRELQYELLQKGEMVYADDIKKDVDKLRAAMDASPSFYHVSGLPQHTESLSQPLMRKRWYTIDAPPGKSFLISDCPVMTVELNGNQVTPGAGFGKDNVAVLLAVTSQKLFVAAPHDGRNWMAVATPAGVDIINRLIVSFGHRNVYANADSADTQFLVDTEINRLVFGQNVFLPSSAAGLEKRV
jgi:hypothetical protein